MILAHTDAYNRPDDWPAYYREVFAMETARQMRRGIDRHGRLAGSLFDYDESEDFGASQAAAENQAASLVLLMDSAAQWGDPRLHSCQRLTAPDLDGVQPYRHGVGDFWGLYDFDTGRHLGAGMTRAACGRLAMAHLSVDECRPRFAAADADHHHARFAAVINRDTGER